MAEDHTILRESLGQILEREGGFHVVGQVQDGREAVEAVERLDPDVVLMDIGMHGMNGLEATRQIKERHPDIRVIILTQYVIEEYVQQAFVNGASAYLVKSSALKDLVSAIGAVMQGQRFISPAVPAAMSQAVLERLRDNPEESPLAHLTKRERDVLRLVAEGQSSRGIAEVLEISTRTVETHRTNLMQKLDLHNTAELTRYAIQWGLGPIE